MPKQTQCGAARQCRSEATCRPIRPRVRAAGAEGAARGSGETQVNSAQKGTVRATSRAELAKHARCVHTGAKGPAARHRLRPAPGRRGHQVHRSPPLLSGSAPHALRPPQRPRAAHARREGVEPTLCAGLQPQGDLPSAPDAVAHWVSEALACGGPAGLPHTRPCACT